MNDNIDNKRLLNLQQFGYVIKTKRKSINMTQQELGRELNVNEATVSRYENGKQEIPSSVLPIIAELCNFEFQEYVTLTRIEPIVRKLHRSFVRVRSRKCAMGPYDDAEWTPDRCKTEYDEAYKNIQKLFNEHAFDKVLFYSEIIETALDTELSNDNDIRKLGMQVIDLLSMELKQNEILYDAAMRYLDIHDKCVELKILEEEL